MDIKLGAYTLHLLKNMERMHSINGRNAGKNGLWRRSAGALHDSPVLLSHRSKPPILATFSLPPTSIAKDYDASC